MIDPPARRFPVAIGIALLVTALGPARTPHADDPPPERVEVEVDPDAARVIVRENRHDDIAGHVVLEDESVIVIRRLDGDLQSFAKGRIVDVVRLVDPEPDQPGVVVLRDGDVRSGIIIEDTFDHVIIEIEGVRTTLSRETVDYVALEPTFEERYAHFKATLRPSMATRHLALCEWLVRERRYVLAKLELDELLSNHRDLEDARRLARIVDAQLALALRPADADAAPKRNEQGATDRELRAQRWERLLTTEDVNLIRVYEIDFDRPPKVAISRETIRRIITEYSTSNVVPADAESLEKLYTADPLRVVEEVIFRLRARELYSGIDVITEPHALGLFRRRVHNAWLINNCATSQCHGGPGAGRLYLHRDDYHDERVRYSNFLTLERLEIDPQWPLVNYEQPEDSLIIQYGLPVTKTRRPHPPVRGWKPAFRSTKDRAVQATIEWIRAMMRPRPEYPIDFEPPTPPAAPAVKPARESR